MMEENNNIEEVAPQVDNEAGNASAQEATDGTDSPNGDVSEETIINKTIENLKTVFDPEIPVDIYSLGLVYKIDYTQEDKTLHVDMTLTAPSCPAADFILEDVRQKLVSIKGPEKVDLRLVFEPEWNQDMMSEEAKLELGFL